jgi:hypothetical protein
MEEHFRTEEAFVSNIDVDHVSIDGLVNESLELGGLNPLLGLLVEFGVVLAVFLEHVLADVAVLFFDASGDFEGVFCLELLASVFEALKGVLCDVAPSQGNAFDTASDDGAITDWEDVRHTVTRINDSASHIRDVKFVDSSCL